MTVDLVAFIIGITIFVWVCNVISMRHKVKDDEISGNVHARKLAAQENDLRALEQRERLMAAVSELLARGAADELILALLPPADRLAAGKLLEQRKPAAAMPASAPTPAALPQPSSVEGGDTTT